MLKKRAKSTDDVKEEVDNGLIPQVAAIKLGQAKRQKKNASLDRQLLEKTEERVEEVKVV